jgi:hypothetical protein
MDEQQDDHSILQTSQSSAFHRAARRRGDTGPMKENVKIPAFFRLLRQAPEILLDSIKQSARVGAEAFPVPASS